MTADLIETDSRFLDDTVGRLDGRPVTGDYHPPITPTVPAIQAHFFLVIARTSQVEPIKSPETPECPLSKLFQLSTTFSGLINTPSMLSTVLLLPTSVV